MNSFYIFTNFANYAIIVLRKEMRWDYKDEIIPS